MKEAQFKPSPALLAVICHHTAPLSLSMARANCSQQFIFSWCLRGQGEGGKTKAKCRSQRKKKIGKRRAGAADGENEREK